MRCAPLPRWRLTRGAAPLALAESIDDEDEVLVVMAEELKRLIPLIGGAEYAWQLLVLFLLLLLFFFFFFFL